MYFVFVYLGLRIFCEMHYCQLYDFRIKYVNSDWSALGQLRARIGAKLTVASLDLIGF